MGRARSPSGIPNYKDGLSKPDRLGWAPGQRIMSISSPPEPTVPHGEELSGGVEVEDTQETL